MKKLTYAQSFKAISLFTQIAWWAIFLLMPLSVLANPASGSIQGLNMFCIAISCWLISRLEIASEHIKHDADHAAKMAGEK